MHKGTTGVIVLFCAAMITALKMLGLFSRKDVRKTLLYTTQHLNLHQQRNLEQLPADWNLSHTLLQQLTSKQTVAIQQHQSAYSYLSAGTLNHAEPFEILA